jgi:putative flippase GtrA
MQAPPDSPVVTPPVRQPLQWRLFLFVVGGLLSTGLNAGPFWLMREVLHWPQAMAYALSLTLVTIVFAIWNYFINFRTDRSLRECTARYLACVGLCSALNYLIVISGLKAWADGWLLIIATVQIGMGGVKFLLYHFWVYPRARQEPVTV